MEGGCDPCGARAQAPPEGSGRRKLHLEPGSGGTGSGACPGLWEAGLGHFPVCAKQETESLHNQAQPEPWTNHVVISSYTNTHTQTQSHPRAWKRPAHTRRQPRPQTACSSSSETRASHPPKLPTTEGPVSPTEKVVSLCPRAGLGRRTPGALPEGRRRQTEAEPPVTLVLGAAGRSRGSRLRSLSRAATGPAGSAPPLLRERHSAGTARTPAWLPVGTESLPLAAPGKEEDTEGWGRELLADVIKNTSQQRKKGPLWARRETQHPVKPQHLGPESGST